MTPYYAAIVNSSGDAIIAYHLDGFINFWNPAAEALFGYTQSETLGRHISILETESHTTEMQDILSKVKCGQSVTHETLRRHKDGRPIAISLTDSPIRDSTGNIVGASKIARDITARRAELEAETTIRKMAEERLLLVIEAAPNAMIMAGVDGRIVLINAQTEKMFGYERQELLGQPIESLVPQRWREGHSQHRADFFANPSARTMGTGRDLFGVRKDGTEMPIEIGLNPLVTQEGHFVLAAIIDITERKRVQDELATAKAEVDLRNKDLETLLHVTSHDLREPLRAIQNFSAILMDRYGAHLDEKGRDLLARVSRGADRLDSLLLNVLNLSRARKILPPNDLLAGHRVVADALAALNSKINETQAQIRVADDLPDLRVSLLWGSVALQNLVANALKFTRENTPPEIEICGFSSPGGEETGLLVRDRGIGVSPHHADRIFELFQRAVGREIEGTGAGLAIVRQIAERHGGRSFVEARDGGGSDFIITFRRSRSGHASAATVS